MWHEQIAEILSGFTRQLCGHIVDATDEHTVATETLHIGVVFGVVETERMVNSGALLHELNGAARISRDITDANEPMRQGRTARTRR